MFSTRADHLSLVSGPAAQPVTLAEAKSHCRIESDDEDVLLQRLIDTATAMVDGRGVLFRAMITQTWAQTGQNWCGKIPLTMTPVQSLSAVKYFDTDGILQTATLSDFRLIGGENLSYVEPVSGASWPQAFDRHDALRVEYVAGYGDASSDVPEVVRNAILMLVGHFYENRESHSMDAPKEVPMGFEALISVERGAWYG